MSCANNRLADFRRGDTYHLALEISDPVSGQRLYIDGWKFTTTLKAALADADAAAKWQITATASGSDAVLGKIQLTVPASVTDTIVPGTYFLDVQRCIPGTPVDVKTIIYQQIDCLPDVTRSLPT